MSSSIKAGQYYAARYQGHNGDLIVGRVKSVRATGEVVLVNLLTDQLSTKSIGVLALRNKRISKAQAVELVETAKKIGKAGARIQAAAMPVFGQRQTELPLTPETPHTEIDIEAELDQIWVKMDQVWVTMRNELRDLIKRVLAKSRKGA